LSVNFGKVGVFFGGISSERDISLKSGNAVCSALIKEGVDIEEIDLHTENREDIENYLRNTHIDIAFIAMHGRFGEDGGLQSVLENLRIPYVGSNSFASRLAMNKSASRNIFKEYNIPVPQSITLTKSLLVDKVPNDLIINRIKEENLDFPLVVKPQNQGSSIGVFFVDRIPQLILAIELAFSYDDNIIIEKKISGKEITVGILGDRALEPIEIRPKADFFDFNAKYTKGLTDYIIPAEISKKTKERVQYLSLKAHRVLGCCHFSRIDLMLDNDENPFILEVNTIPGFTETSLFPKAAAYEGISFSQLCIRLLEMAQRDFQHQYANEK